MTRTSTRYRIPASPILSVIVPVHQGREHLQRVLAALAATDLPRKDWELIVVDDASTDGSAEIAAGFADLVIRLTGQPRGPAYARNRGFEVARSAHVAFVDADVLVHPRALSLMLDAMREDPGTGAVMGSYDAERTSRGIVSEYRNLLRHVEHRTSAGDADAFAAGLALVRRDAFRAAGMFDEWHFPRPQAEALELGDRLRELGYRMRRHPGAQATHLKQWTFAHWIAVDLIERGMAMARLSAFRGLRARADRLYIASPLDAALAWMAAAGVIVGAWRGTASWIAAGLTCMLIVAVRHAHLFASLARVRGVAFAIASIPLHTLTCGLYGMASAVGRLLYHTIGEPQPEPVIQAFAEVGVRTWPPVPVQRVQTPSTGVPRSPDGGTERDTSRQP